MPCCGQGRAGVWAHLCMCGHTCGCVDMPVRVRARLWVCGCTCVQGAGSQAPGCLVTGRRGSAPVVAMVGGLGFSGCWDVQGQVMVDDSLWPV